MFRSISKRTRDHDPRKERIVADLLLNAVAEITEIPARVPLNLKTSEQLVRTEAIASPELQTTLHWENCAVTSDLQQHAPGTKTEHKKPSVIFPGSFNPLHDAHLQMVQIAGHILHCPIEYEISVTNVDKPPLRLYRDPKTSSTILQRAATLVDQRTDIC